MRTAAAMTRDVVVVPPEMLLRAARKIMEHARIRHLPVVKHGRLQGILSDRDLLRFEGGDLDGMATLVSEAMTPAPITCAISTTISRVAQIMLEHKIDSLPVVDPSGTLVGLVTSSDLLQLLVESADVQALPFHYRLHLREEDGLAAESDVA
jgi:CBS domain-containing membrane protein